MRISPEIEALIARLARLPGLGPRSARRAALALLQAPEARLQPLIAAMQEAARTIQTCPECGNLDSCSPCSLCADPQRDGTVICVVETVGDLWAMERSGTYRGRYQILGGVLSALSGLGPDDLNLAGLLTHLQEGTVQEVIIALGATVEGATTAHWLQEKLSPYAVKITRLGHGVPMGGALDVLDEGTLAAALSSRRAL